jgi:hypothetical protein
MCTLERYRNYKAQALTGSILTEIGGMTALNRL